MQDLGDRTELPFPASVTAVTFPTSVADLEAMALPAIVLSLDGKILALNAAVMRLGTRRPDEIVGRMAWEFAPGMEYLWDERVAAARAPGGERFEIAITTGRGAWMLEYVFKVCELDGQPAVIGVITSARPLT
jgi:PAS domain-containing protein